MPHSKTQIHIIFCSWTTLSYFSNFINNHMWTMIQVKLQRNQKAKSFPVQYAFLSSFSEMFYSHKICVHEISCFSVETVAFLSTSKFNYSKFKSHSCESSIRLIIQRFWDKYYDLRCSTCSYVRRHVNFDFPNSHLHT